MESRIAVPNQLEYIKPVQAYISSLAERKGMPEHERKKLALALEEILANVITHGLGHMAEAHFAVIVIPEETRLQICVRESGIPFDFSQMPDYSPEKLVAEGNAQGLGGFLARQALDGLEYRSLGRAGKEVRLFKNYPALAGEKEEQVVNSNPETRPAYRIRAAEPEDAAQIARSAYWSYGYTYEDDYYWPEKLKDKLRRQLLHSFVAVTENGEVVGHLGIKCKKTGDHMGEIGAAFVNPEYRGSTMFFKLTTQVKKRMEAADMEVLYSLAVTNHIISQKANAVFGGTDGAIFLGWCSDERRFVGIGTGEVQRISVVASFFLRRKRMKTILYLPKAYQMIAAQIYEGLGEELHLANSGSGELAGNTCLDTERLPERNGAIIRLSKWGADLAAMLNKEVRNLTLDKVAVIYLYLDMETSMAEKAADICRKAGFFLAGMWPRGLDGKDALILQYLNVRMDLTQVHLATPLARNILALIDGEMPEELRLVNQLQGEEGEKA